MRRGLPCTSSATRTAVDRRFTAPSLDSLRPSPRPVRRCTRCRSSRRRRGPLRRDRAGGDRALLVPQATEYRVADDAADAVRPSQRASRRRRRARCGDDHAANRRAISSRPNRHASDRRAIRPAPVPAGRLPVRRPLRSRRLRLLQRRPGPRPQRRIPVRRRRLRPPGGRASPTGDVVGPGARRRHRPLRHDRRPHRHHAEQQGVHLRPAVRRDPAGGRPARATPASTPPTAPSATSAPVRIDETEEAATSLAELEPNIHRVSEPPSLLRERQQPGRARPRPPRRRHARHARAVRQPASRPHRRNRRRRQREDRPRVARRDHLGRRPGRPGAARQPQGPGRGQRADARHDLPAGRTEQPQAAARSSSPRPTRPCRAKKSSSRSASTTSATA